MKLKVIATLVLVVAALPIATAHAPVIDGPDATSNGNDVGPLSSDDSREYTELYIDSDNSHPQLKPGESHELTVTVKNGEDSAVTVDPHLYVPPMSENVVEESWVSIEGDTTIEAGEEREFTVTVSVPTDAKTGYYGGRIAFTDEKVTYPGGPARPVHSATLRVEVWKEPTVTIASGTYLRGQVEAGDSVTRQIVVENAGDETVPVNPQFTDERSRCHGDCPSVVDPTWVDIDAPTQIAPGETATVTVTISPPETADSGHYRGRFDLGLKDPARDERDNYWQRIDLRFDVWNQPDEAFETSFDVNEDTENVSLTLSPRSSTPGGSSSASAGFDVELVRPDGTTVQPERVRLTDRGFVDLSGSRNDAVQRQGDYAINHGGQEFVYRVDEPVAGTWQARITPENVVGFTYEITRNESSE